MTTERPYAGARTVEEAAGEIRAGRGTQFAPAVVDAFLVALRRNPHTFVTVEADDTFVLAAS